MALFIKGKLSNKVMCSIKKIEHQLANTKIIRLKETKDTEYRLFSCWIYDTPPVLLLSVIFTEFYADDFIQYSSTARCHGYKVSYSNASDGVCVVIISRGWGFLYGRYFHSKMSVELNFSLQKGWKFLSKLQLSLPS